MIELMHVVHLNSIKCEYDIALHMTVIVHEMMSELLDDVTFF